MNIFLLQQETLGALYAKSQLHDILHFQLKFNIISKKECLWRIEHKTKTVIMNYKSFKKNHLMAQLFN